MNTKQLVFFIAAANKNSITAAARELDVAQPAISQHLANLEYELKTKLFERDFRGVRLTESGRRFYEHAVTIMEQVEVAKTDIISNQKNPIGTVSIGMAQAVCNVLAIPLLEEVNIRYPNIKLQLQCASPDFLNKWLSNGEIDLAVSYENTFCERHFSQLRLIKEKIYLVVGSQNTKLEYKELLHKQQIRFEDIAHFEIVMPNEQDPLVQMLKRYEKETGIEIKRKQNYGLLMTSLRYVTDGLGLILLPSSAFFHLKKQSMINAIEIIEPNISRDVLLIHNTQHANSIAKQAIYDLVKEITLEANEDGRWQGNLF